MLTKCYVCKGKMHSEEKEYHYTECGLQHVYLKDIPVFVCETCGSEMPQIPNMASLHFTIATDLLRKKGPLCGEEIRFLRKVSGLKATELATFLEVDSTTLSKWETGTRKIGSKSDRALRLVIYAGILERLFIVTDENLTEKVSAAAKSRPHLDIRDFFRRVEGKRTPKRIVIDPKELSGFGVSDSGAPKGLLSGAVN